MSVVSNPESWDRAAQVVYGHAQEMSNRSAQDLNRTPVGFASASEVDQAIVTHMEPPTTQIAKLRLTLLGRGQAERQALRETAQAYRETEGRATGLAQDLLRAVDGAGR